MTSELIINILGALSPVILIVVSHLIFRVSKYLSAKTKSEETRQLIDQVDDVVDSVVKSVFQTYISKQKIQNNRLEPEIAAKAKEMAVTQIKDNLGQANLDKVQKTLALPDTDSILSTKVEAAVYNMKKTVLPMILFAFCLPLMACHAKPTVIATTVVDTQRKAIAGLDKSANLWYTFRQTECTNKAIDAQNLIIKNASLSPEETQIAANKAGYAAYDSCIELPNKIIDKIVVVVNLARKENKIAAQTILDVIRGKSLVSTLGDVTTPVVSLILEIKKLMDDNGVIITSYN